jgi:hypothetical protein
MPSTASRSGTPPALLAPGCPDAAVATAYDVVPPWLIRVLFMAALAAGLWLIGSLSHPASAESTRPAPARPVSVSLGHVRAAMHRIPTAIAHDADAVAGTADPGAGTSVRARPDTAAALSGGLDSATGTPHDVLGRVVKASGVLNPIATTILALPRGVPSPASATVEAAHRTLMDQAPAAFEESAAESHTASATDLATGWSCSPRSTPSTVATRAVSLTAPATRQVTGQREPTEKVPVAPPLDGLPGVSGASSASTYSLASGQLAAGLHIDFVTHFVVIEARTSAAPLARATSPAVSPD